jgi:hypothetical protein
LIAIADDRTVILHTKFSVNPPTIGKLRMPYFFLFEKKNALPCTQATWTTLSSLFAFLIGWQEVLQVAPFSSDVFL